MKLVKEHINEKFSEDSDPIKDLQIGGININKEWNELWKRLSYESDESQIDKEWKKLLKQFFVGKIVTGNFHQGNSDSYGGLHYELTTRKPVVRIELEDSEGPGEFSLVTKEKDSWVNSNGQENWVDPDEVWYFVKLDENPGRKIFVSE